MTSGVAVIIGSGSSSPSGGGGATTGSGGIGSASKSESAASPPPQPNPSKHAAALAQREHCLKLTHRNITYSFYQRPSDEHPKVASNNQQPLAAPIH
jgi:hypothetical protein